MPLIARARPAHRSISPKFGPLTANTAVNGPNFGESVVEDLGTTVQKMQLAIACYTLIMAAFMLAGASLGDLWGRRRAFVIGLMIYGCGSLTTALAPNFPTLFVGWSVIEGLGAVLVIPAIAALAATNYHGRERAIAYGLLGGISGAAAAGPVIGGWVTSTLNWRVVFASEVVIVLAVLLARNVVDEGDAGEPRHGFDIPGVFLSAIGLGLVVISLVQSSTWGWVSPRKPPFTVVGFAPTVPLVLVGSAVTWGFIGYERRQTAADRPTLFHPALLEVPVLQSGLGSLVVQQFVICGAFFVLPLYLQILLGKDAFASGVKILPLSVGLFVLSLVGSRLSSKMSPRRIVRAGLTVMAAGIIGVVATIEPTLRGGAFGLSMFVFGAGVGLVLSQLGNVNLSAVDESRSSEVGGLQGTAQNLGASLGTAIVGAVLLSGLYAGFTGAVQKNPAVPAPVAAKVASQASAGLTFVPLATVTRAVDKAGISGAEATAIEDAYSTAQINALKSALALVAVIGFAGILITRRLPSDALPTDPDGEPAADGPPKTSAA